MLPFFAEDSRGGPIPAPKLAAHLLDAPANPDTFPQMSALTPQQKRSASLIIIAQTATKLGDVLTNPKTVLTWLLASLGVSGAVLSMLVPIRESGSMLPQLFISDWVKRVRRRKRVFVVGALAQGLAIATMGLAALTLPATAAGIVVLGALGLFSIARAFCSISAKDVLGRTVPKGFRGRVGGISNTISGILSAAAAISLIFYRREGSGEFLAWLILGASLLWVLGAAFYAGVAEEVPESSDDAPHGQEGIIARLTLVRQDPQFRTFIIARSLLLGTALASPVLVLLGQQSGTSLNSLVGFVVASGLATSSSSFLWGRLADRAGRLAMACGGFFSAGIGTGAVLLAKWPPPWMESVWAWPALFFLFNIGYEGVRIGRKTWVVDAVEGDRRTDYVSASNTLIAIIILLIGTLNSPLQAWNPSFSLAAYSAFCVSGGIFALRLKDSA